MSKQQTRAADYSAALRFAIFSGLVIERRTHEMKDIINFIKCLLIVVLCVIIRVSLDQAGRRISNRILSVTLGPNEE